ncbi:MAG TPA: MFS transporter [Burkholderiales bacterium]|nr:MFS transporter [Burkholderiales bacterium]
MSLAFLVFALLAGHTFASMAMTIVPAIAPAIARDYGVDPSLIGYQIAFVSLGQVACLMFFANLSRKVGACRAYQIGLAGLACGMLLVALPSKLLLLAGSLVIGLGHGVLTPASASLLMRYSPPAKRNFLFSFQQTGVPLGGMSAALVGPAVAVTAGWPWALGLTALLLAFMVIALQRGRPFWDTDRDPGAAVVAANPFEGVVRVWRDRRLRALALTGGAYCWGQFVVISYTVVAAVTELGMTLIVAGTVLTIVHLGSMGGRVVAGWLADRANGTRVLVWNGWLLLATAAASCGMGPGWPAIALYILFALLGVATGAWAGLLLAESSRLAPHGQAGATTSGVMVYVNAGKLLGPVVFANIYAATQSYGASFASLAVPALLALYSLTALIGGRAHCREEKLPA